MKKDISRRQFLKLGGAAAVASSALLAACKGGNKQQFEGLSTQEPPKDQMTMRVNPNTGDKVSLLGYGMMRLPVEGGLDLRDNPDANIDQEMVNREVDYAIEHGVNYFDTSPAYCRGKSEESTGIALHRHPRDKYFVATKMSNFSPDTWPKKESMQMFENSLTYLQVDYIDYLLLHAIGGSSKDKDAEETFNARYMDNGILDWLVEQKQRGRIRNLGFSYHGDVSIFDMLLKWHDEGRYHWDFVQIELNYLDWEYANEINDRNTDAVYLYGELKKRGIPAVIMEPLLGGRLANVPDPIVAKMKQREPERSVASWAFRFAGTPDGVLTVDQWLKLPQQSLLEATAGAVFRDDLGEVSAIRAALSRMPEDVRKKRLAGHLLLMAQAGQYNYLRCLKHGEPAAAQLAVNEFVKSCIQVVFLLNRTYAPYYKWSFRALRRLDRLALTAETLEYLLTTGNDGDLAESKYDMIESTAADVIDELMDQGLTKAVCGDLEKHAYSVNDGIEDGDVRNLHILYTI